MSTAKENLIKAIKGEPHYTPVSSEQQMFCPNIIPDNVARGLVVEAVGIDNDTQAGGPDMFGVPWVWVPVVGGSMVNPELPQLIEDIADWESIVKFPDLDAYDWEGCAARNKEFLAEKNFTVVWQQNGIFERLISFMSFEDAAIALVDDDQKPHVHRLFTRLCDFYEDLIGRYKKYFDADILYFHDDWGSQRSQFCSTETVREMVLPYLKRLVDFTHANDMIFDFHSCGKIEELVAVMVDAGVDIWSGQEVNDKIAVLQQHAGKILIEASANFDFDKMFDYTEDDYRKFAEDFLAKYGDWLDNVILMALPTDTVSAEVVNNR